MPPLTHPSEPTLTRNAATVLVLRDAPEGLEVFCVKRSARSSFLAEAVVFPGGKVDPSDADAGWAALSDPPAPRAEAFASAGLGARALAVAACRELLEEGCLLPVTVPLDHAGALALRAEVAQGSFAASLRRRGLRLALSQLVPWARWVTPVGEAQRFDTCFFLLRLPDGQRGEHDAHETTTSFWARPAEVLERFSVGQLMLVPPTTRSLELLSAARSIDAAIKLASRQRLDAIHPLHVAGEPPLIVLPGDPLHPSGTPIVEGATRFALSRGRYQSAGA